MPRHRQPCANCDNDSHLQWRAYCSRLLARVQDRSVPTALVARHHRRAGAVGDGVDRRVDVVRKRDRAVGQSGHRAIGTAACVRRAAVADRCIAAQARSGPAAGGHAHADRPHRRASVHRTPGRQRWRAGVFRSLYWRTGCRSPVERCVCIYRRSASSSDCRQARSGSDRCKHLDPAVLLRIGPVSALAATLVESAHLVGGGMAAAGAQFSVEPARGVRHLVSAGVSAGCVDRADLVLHLVSRWHGGLARHRAGDAWRRARSSAGHGGFRSRAAHSGFHSGHAYFCAGSAYSSSYRATAERAIPARQSRPAIVLTTIWKSIRPAALC